MSGRETAAVRWLVILVALLGLTGFVLSFEKVQRAVEPSFGGLSPLVPLGIDLGIAVFTGLDLLMARLNMRTKWLRLVPWGLVGVTVALNVSGESTLVGRVAHAAMPMLWVVAVEAGAHVIRVQVGLADAERMDRIRGSRWWLAPVSTLRLWRHMVLWEVRSYPDALERRQDRLLALCDLQDGHGWLSWRWRAPRRERTLHKLGRLAPRHALPAGTEPEPESDPVKPEQPRLNGNLRDAARAIAGQLELEGKSVSRRTLMDRLRAEGYRLGTQKADELARELRGDA